MTKYVEVEACKGCIFAQIKYVEYLGKYDNACKKAKRPLDEFGWDTTVPTWCPLPNLKEKEI